MSEQIENEDFLGLASDASVKQYLNGEKLIYSCKVIKENRFGMNQERSLVISDKAIYNLKEKEFQRRIEITKIKGITVSKISDQFVIHGNEEEYDYLIISKNKVRLITLIQEVYESFTAKDLLFTISTEKKLGKLVATKKEKANNPKTFKMDTSHLIDIQEFIIHKGVIDLNIYFAKTAVLNSLKKNYKYEEHTLDDFEILKCVGMGRGSKIYAAKYKKDNDKLCALKVIDKTYIAKHNLFEELILEKDILSSFDCPFIAQMLFHFQTTTKIVFVLPFYKKGDLFQYLINKKTIGETNVAFIAVQIAIMLEALHEKNILYRDLKPENICIDDNGYLCLVDFGLCKVLETKDELSTSFCGSTEYMSPEMIKGEGHNRGTDLWAFGILIYELLYGYVPFRDDKKEYLLDLITEAELRFSERKKLSKNALDFILKVSDIIFNLFA